MSAPESRTFEPLQLPPPPADWFSRWRAAAPRYTSYPTAVDFQDTVGPEAYAEALQAARPEDPLDLYLHVPFCESRCTYCACHVIVRRDPAVGSDYVDDLLREAETVAAQTGSRPLHALHLGGGTPNYLDPEDLDRLLEGVRALFPPLPDLELATELDPRVLVPEHLPVLRRHGLSRVSFGVQDVDPDVQAAIGRIQPQEMTARAVAAAREAGVPHINVDLVYGLPGQTSERFARTLDSIVELAPARIALFHFAYLPERFALQRKIDADALPGLEARVALFAQAVERFTSAGWDAVGLDHFARPDDELARAARDGRLIRNFQGYAVRGATDLVGMGVSAIGNVGRGYFQNAPAIGAWREAVRAGQLATVRGVLRDADDERRWQRIQDLMCRGEVRLADDVEDVDWTAEHMALVELANDGLLKQDGGRFRVTGLGRWQLRTIAAVFDRYLARHGAQRFSKVN